MKKILVILTFLLVLSACKRNNFSEVTFEELNISAAVSTTKTTASQSSFSDGNSFSLWITNSRGALLQGLSTSRNYADNVKYEYQSGSLVNQEDKVTFPDPTSTLGVYAVYPYVSTPTLAVVGSDVVYKHSVKTDQSSLANVVSSDLMTATWGSTGVTRGVTATMNFFHRLARLDISISVPTTYGDYTLTGVTSVKLVNMKVNANVILSVKSTSPDNAAGYDPNTSIPATVDGAVSSDITAYNYDTQAAVGGFKVYNYEAIVVPQSISAGEKFVEITVRYNHATKGDLDKVYPYFIGTTAVPIVVGKSNSLGLNLTKPYPIALGSITINDWTAANSTGGFDYATVKNQFVTQNSVTPSDCDNAEVHMSGGKTYKVNVTYDVTGGFYSFEFTGTSTLQEPNVYPFTIESIQFYKGTTASTLYNCDSPVTVTEASATPIQL